MKKIVIIDGGPRKNMNTAQMIDSFAKGVKSASDEIEVKTIRLYDLEYKGCVACLACKVRGSKFHDVCARKDGLTDALHEAAYADGLVLATPIYFSRATAQLEAFMERLIYPWLSYNDMSIHAPKRIPTAVIYTMNAYGPHMHLIRPGQEQLESLLALSLEKPERIEALNTMQIKNYDRYDMDGFAGANKENYREEHWLQDLQSAFDAGKRMAEKI